MKDTMPKWIERVAIFLTRLPRSQKRLVMVAADAVFIPLALWCAVLLRFGTRFPQFEQGLWFYATALLASILVFARLGLYRAVIRFLSGRALATVVAGVTSSALVLLTLTLGAYPRVVVIYWALALIYVAGSRFMMRAIMNYRRARGNQRVAIYGAGSAGVQLVEALRSAGRFHPIAFVDDNESLHGGIVAGIEVFPPIELAQLVKEEDIGTILLALPSQSRRRRQEVLKSLEPLKVLVQTVPDFSDIAAGYATVADVRDVDANDLLGRDPVPPNLDLLDGCITGKAVMVTGAGGSIGSELCRQILRLGPTRLVLLEMSELALYGIEKELRLFAEKFDITVELVPLLGNAHHKVRVKEVIQSYEIQTIYHAAAYKHVPIVEHNVLEGIHNNVFSTWHMAEAASDCNVETFVLISTDKAVNPTNVMGATKRLAEIVLQGLQQRNTRTRFCMVRFGNVLESSGSVVPLFREQIRRGGPITVTHKDVIRYFMTIPEAAQLVLQAGSMAKGGDVFVLEMGKPVRIDDLARRMIHLMGLSLRDSQNPDGDIEIVYTGLRPAEKLFEELLIGTNVTGTEHPRIMRAMEHSMPWATVRQILDELSSAVHDSDCQRARNLLVRAVEEYAPAEGIQDLVWSRANRAARSSLASVTELTSRRIQH